MARTTACPREADLLALAVGDEPPPELLAHLDSCPRCWTRVRRLKAEVLCLRAAPGSTTTTTTAATSSSLANGRGG